MLKKLILLGVLGYAYTTHAQCTLTPIAGQTTHQAILSWQASTAPSVGYNVYSCADTAANCGAPFTGVITNFSQVLRTGWKKVIGSIPSTQLTYTDKTVTAGGTYTYVVTAYDTLGNNWESGASNTCTGTVPNPSGGGTTSGQTPPPGQLTGSVQ